MWLFSTKGSSPSLAWISNHVGSPLVRCNILRLCGVHDVQAAGRQQAHTKTAKWVAKPQPKKQAGAIFGSCSCCCLLSLRQAAVLHLAPKYMQLWQMYFS